MLAMLLASQISIASLDAALYLNDARFVIDRPRGSVLRFDGPLQYHRVEEERLENRRARSRVNVVDTRARGEFRFRQSRDGLQVQFTGQWRPFNEQNCSIRQITFDVTGLPFERTFDGPNGCTVRVEFFEYEE